MIKNVTFAFMSMIILVLIVICINQQIKIDELTISRNTWTKMYWNCEMIKSAIEDELWDLKSIQNMRTK
jgi:hypothetical protein